MIAINLYQTQPGAPLVHAPGQACDQCRRRKTRCDRGSACAHCRRLGTGCTYAETPRRRGPRPRGKRNGSLQEKPQHPCSPNETEKVPAGSVSDDTVQAPFLKEFSLDENDSSLQPAQGQTPLNMNSTAEELPPTALFPSPDSLDFSLWNEDSSPRVSSEYFGADLQAGPPSFQQILGDAVKDVSPVCVEPQPFFAPSEQWHGLQMNGKESRHLLPRSIFHPYVDLFFSRLYPVFPVIERRSVHDVLLEDGSALTDNHYALLTSLSAAVIVQLNLCEPKTPGPDGSLTVGNQSADLFVDQCLQTRKRNPDLIEDADEWTVLTSFFLFAYYGNLDRSKSAWYYLREAIGFAQSLGLDDPESYEEWDVETQQRRRQLFWLLFITERAYALQHRRSVMLRPTIELPKVFESPNPKLIYGFVALTKLFKSVDNSFITAWRTQKPLLNSDGAATEEEAEQTMTMVNQEKLTETLSLSEIDETQRLDVLITQQWLRLLVCQLHTQSSKSIQKGMTQRFPVGAIRSGQHILDVSRNLLQIITSASQASLESHGIGMEQKVADVANSLCDSALVSTIMENSAELFGAPDLLHSFMTFLSVFRNRESQYLAPLVGKVAEFYAAKFGPTACSVFLGPVDDYTGAEHSLHGSMGLA